MAIEQIDDSGWPSGDNSPLLLLSCSPEDLADRFGLVFTVQEDDLGELKLAVVRGPGFGIVGLIRYNDAPFEGTTVYASVEADAGAAHDAFVRELGIAESAVTWVSTDLRPG